MISITIDDRELRTALDRLARRVEDTSPAMRAIAAELETRISDRFDAQRDPQGRAWAPLSGKTLARKKGRGRILYHSGDLLDSLTSRASRSEAEVGFGKPYAAFHEYGTQKMPRRGLLMADPQARTLGDEDRAAILDIIERWIEGRPL